MRDDRLFFCISAAIIFCQLLFKLAYNFPDFTANLILSIVLILFLTLLIKSEKEDKNAKNKSKERSRK